MDRMELYALYRQKASLMNERQNTQSHISALNTKINRLLQASNELTGHLSSLNSQRKKVQNLTVDDSQWKGTQKNSFQDRYDQYKESVSRFLSETEGKKDQLDEEIRQAEISKGNYEARLTSLSSQIAGVDRQIAQMRRG